MTARRVGSVGAGTVTAALAPVAAAASTLAPQLTERGDADARHLEEILVPGPPDEFGTPEAGPLEIGDLLRREAVLGQRVRRAQVLVGRVPERLVLGHPGDAAGRRGLLHGEPGLLDAQQAGDLGVDGGV